MTPGTILLVYHKGFLPDQIRMHMALLGKKLGKNYLLRWNHAEILVMHKGQLMSMGARSGGAEMTPFEEYVKKNPDYIALTPVNKLTLSESRKLEAYANEVCFENKRKYQRGNFLGWIGYMKTGIRMIGKGDKRVYCYELAARCADLVDRWRGRLDYVSVYDLWENKHYVH